MCPLPAVVVGSEEPLYNIGVVSRMTGVSMATLRAWERRYNFPESVRTAGGHRLYSERDVLSLRWVKERIEEGMQTAQAVNALRHQEEAGKIVREELTGLEIERDLRPYKNAGSILKSYEEQLFQSLTQRDLISADNILGEALAVSSPESLILDVIGPTFSRIGTAWEEGKISVAAEHLATNYLRQRLLMWMMSGPPPRSTYPVVLACAPNEWHEGSLLILGALLRRRRWPVAYLGQAVPLGDLAGFVRDLKPSMLVLVAMTASPASEMVDWPQYIPNAAQTGKPPVGYGGRIFVIEPQWRLRMAGSYLGDTLVEGVDNIETLLPKVIG
jgi:DNA-binding transcriptional MerR regulator